VLVLSLALCCSSALGDEQTPKRVRVGANFAVPLAYLAPDGKPAGFFVEVMREAALREGLDVEMVMRRDSVDAALPSGEIDLWAGAVSTEERRRKLHFTEPWWSLDHYITVKEASPVQRPEDLAGKVVVFTPTPPFSIELQQLMPGARLKPMPNLRERFEALCMGQADAVLFYQETALFAVTGANEFLECRQSGLRVIPVKRPIVELAVVSLPAQKELAERFRRRIGEMMHDGSIEKLPSFRMTGDNSLVMMMQAQRLQSRQHILQISLAFAVGLAMLSVIAYARLRMANRRAVQALALARQAAQAKGEFLALMSHEIRTPMTAVLGYMDMLLNTPLRHDQRQFAIEVSQATASLLTMLTTVLDYSRSLGGNLPIQSVEFDLASVIDDSISGVLLQAESKGLEVTVHLHRNVPATFIGDPVRIRHMVTNLATNAVKFTESGGLHVEAICHKDAGGSVTLELAVSDSGVGISKEKQALIFLPFTQVDSTDSRSTAGIGLGLAIVSDLVKQLGGTVSVESEPGNGSRFTLRLPLRSSNEDSWLTFLRQEKECSALILSRPSRQITILEEYLEWAGYTLQRLSSVEQMGEVLTQLRVTRPNSVLCLVDGAEYGEEASRAIAACREQGLTTGVTFILLGSMRYLGGPPQNVKSAFHRVLPLPAGRRALREALLPQHLPHSPEPVTIAKPILVVDDNPVNRRVLSALLEKLGCVVETANNGTEALSKALRADYGLILMDCQMPEMNGYEATEAIRKDPIRGARVHICGLSAAVDPEVRVRCLAAGMNDYLPKPVTLDGLRELVLRFSAN